MLPKASKSTENRLKIGTENVFVSKVLLNRFNIDFGSILGRMSGFYTMELKWGIRLRKNFVPPPSPKGGLNRFLNRFGTDLGPTWAQFGTILGPSWDNFGAVRGQCWGHLVDTLQSSDISCTHSLDKGDFLKIRENTVVLAIFTRALIICICLHEKKILIGHM